MKIKSIGIIGFGQFGQLVASLVPPDVKMIICESADAAAHGYSQHTGSIAEVARCNVVVLAVPLASYSEVLGQLKLHLLPSTLVVDVCSIKTSSQRIVNEILPHHPAILCSHPLFGPRSARKGLAGRTLIVTQQKGELAEAFVQKCQQKFGLDVRRMSADEHDRFMAYGHALTFFVARGLADCHMPGLPITVPSYEPIQKLITMDAEESDALFRTIQQGNPYASEVRKKLISALIAIDNALIESV